MSTCNRRRFLQSSLAGVAGVVCASEPALGADDDAPKIIDAHVHFYDPTRPQGVPWPGKNDKLLYRPFLPKDFKALTEKQHVTGVIVVEASSWLEDNQWVLDIAKDDPFVLGLVGHLTPGVEEFGKHVERFAKNSFFRGIRINQGDLQKGLEKKEYVNDVKLLAKHDLELDVNGGPDMPALVAKLAERLPDLRIVINHAANLPCDGKAPPDNWLTGMRAAAKHRNVFCKVSALVEGTGRKNGDAPREMKYYQPALQALWDTFGAERLIYASNWPVAERYATYPTMLGIVREFFDSKGKDAASRFFEQNARVAYKCKK
jgi:predicted TIM-barrel fold metal-dependent hydrolase